MTPETVAAPAPGYTPAAAQSQSRSRIDSVDVVRGLVMILMALDHTRDFFGARVDPTDVAHTTVALFFTRWVTHVCAPTFFLLTGTGAALSRRRQSTGELSRFLLTRGIWLIFLELVVIRCIGFQFNFDYRVTLLIVIWALGWAMIVLSVLVHLPDPVIGAIGIAIIAGHNLFDGVRATNPLLAILHGPGFVLGPPGPIVFVSYALIPWVGVTAVGYVLGNVYSWDAERRRAFLGRLGVALLCAFVVIRMIDRYGDPRPWSVQPTASHTVISFFNATKYPPSLVFLLMTLGLTLLALRAFDAGVPRLFAPAVTYGRVPLFYFLLHLPLIHLLAMGVAYARYGAVHWFVESPTLDRYPFTVPPGWGYPLGVVYAVWALVVIALYVPCAWFARVRARSSAVWLRYL